MEPYMTETTWPNQHDGMNMTENFLLWGHVQWLTFVVVNFWVMFQN